MNSASLSLENELRGKSHTEKINKKYDNIKINDVIIVSKRVMKRRPKVEFLGEVIFKGTAIFCVKFDHRIESFSKNDLIDRTIEIY